MKDLNEAMSQFIINANEELNIIKDNFYTNKFDELFNITHKKK